MNVSGITGRLLIHLRDDHSQRRTIGLTEQDASALLRELSSNLERKTGECLMSEATNIQAYPSWEIKESEVPGLALAVTVEFALEYGRHSIVINLDTFASLAETPSNIR